MRLVRQQRRRFDTNAIGSKLVRSTRGNTMRSVLHQRRRFYTDAVGLTPIRSARKKPMRSVRKRCDRPPPKRTMRLVRHRCRRLDTDAVVGPSASRRTPSSPVEGLNLDSGVRGVFPGHALGVQPQMASGGTAVLAKLHPEHAPVPRGGRMPEALP